ncbi:MAG TPA: DUF2163 domain-containing protein [Candidatus Cloacimonas acidaminovorans]|nr:DUF2163 domain-containing protein [Candidatus Cloacimonas acidaminovorans]
MYDMDVNFIEEKNKLTNKPIYLYTIFDYDGAGSNLYFAESDTNIIFDGITYQKFPIKHSEIGENSSGEIDSFDVQISNVSRFMQAYLEAYDFRGKKIEIMLVWADRLDEAENKIKFTFYIDSYNANEKVVNFKLTSKFDLLDVQLPFGTYNRNYCRWRFKSSECGYTGTVTSCKKTKQECRDVMNNVLRYGGFPSIPANGKRIFV